MLPTDTGGGFRRGAGGDVMVPRTECLATLKWPLRGKRFPPRVQEEQSVRWPWICGRWAGQGGSRGRGVGPGVKPPAPGCAERARQSMHVARSLCRGSRCGPRPHGAQSRGRGAPAGVPEDEGWGSSRPFPGSQQRPGPPDSASRGIDQGLASEGWMRRKWR